MDCFLFEGPKVLLRISLTLIQSYTKSSLSVTDFFFEKYFLLEIQKDSHGNLQTMGEFCQEIPLSLDRLLDVRSGCRFL